MYRYSSESTLAQKLRQARERAGLTQEEVARALGVSRELVSLWENGERVPGAAYLARLASLYGVKEKSLFSPRPLEPLEDLKVLLREEAEEGLSPKARLELQNWLDFLDAYADFLEGEGLPSPYLKRPPKEIGVYKSPLTDLRQASSRALETRKAFALGEDAIPEPYTFLEEVGILVYKASLGSEPGKSVWGAFYKHPRLGFSVLVNADSTPGRQAFTLAHELAHAFYHHQALGIVCRREGLTPEEEALEEFANAWAAHFLVPGKALRRKAQELVKVRGRFGPEEALLLAHHFRVSYALLLFRLKNEGLIGKEELEEWKAYSPQSMAQKLGLPQGAYTLPRSRGELGLSRYPPSVLLQVRRAVLEDRLSVSEASGLLDVDSAAFRDFLAPPKREANPEVAELEEELDFTSPGRKGRAVLRKAEGRAVLEVRAALEEP
ncbi:ImmA/IrrE family metallo-endopeptidase [Thermus oshimai]